jgi:hypothetical protein
MPVALHACAALALALVTVLAVGAPAQAVEHRLRSPQAGSTHTGEPFHVIAQVDADVRPVAGVQVRVLRDGEPYGAPRAMELQDEAADTGPGSTSTWWVEEPLDPRAAWLLDGAAMHNGTYRVETRVTMHSLGGTEDTDWAGHDVVLDAPARAPAVRARVVDQATRTVEVTWDASTVPDFRRYVLQREGADGWADVAAMTAPSEVRAVDVVPEPGAYRYRVVVVRASADGDDLPTTSEARSVTIDPPPPQPSEPPPTETDERAGEDGDAGGAGADGDPADDAGTERPSGPPSVPSTGGSSAPSFRSEDTPTAPPTTGQVQGMHPDLFEETLPYEDVAEMPEQVRERVTHVTPGEVVEGGTLSIHERELAIDQVLTPVAGGLLLFVVAGHVLRLRRE